MITPGPRSDKAENSQGMSNGIALGAGLGVAIGATWDKKHPPIDVHI